MMLSKYQNIVTKFWKTIQARVVCSCFMAAFLPQIWNIYYDMFQWHWLRRSIDVIFYSFREKSPASVTKVQAVSGSWLLFWILNNNFFKLKPDGFRVLNIIFFSNIYNYRIYPCISRPFMTKKSTQKIALDLCTSHTQRPDQAIQEISITIAWSAFRKIKFTKPALIVLEFHQLLAQPLPTKKCEKLKIKWFKSKPTRDDF